MIKELVAVKPSGTWDIILDVSLSEGKNLTEENDVIDIIKQNYSELANVNFVVEGIDMFVEVNSMTTVNPGDACKI